MSLELDIGADPDLEAVVSTIRGFDLGDDAVLLTELAERRDDSAAALSGEQYLLLGVLYLRADQYEDAAASLEHAIDQRHSVGVARYLQSHALKAAGKLSEATAVLDLAEDWALHDDSVSRAGIAHARAELAWAQGDREKALFSFREALKRDPTSAPRWVQTGVLLAELEQRSEAEAAFRRALVEQPDLHQAMYQRALLAVQQGDINGAADWLHRAATIDGANIKRCRDDVRFQALYQHAEFASLIAPQTEADVSWLNSLGPWLRQLQSDCQEEKFGITWLSQGQSDEISASMRRMYEHGPVGTLHTAATLELSHRLFGERVLIAKGPTTVTRERIVEDSLLFADLKENGRLYLALSATFPPFMWIPVGSSVHSLRRTLSEFFPQPARRRKTMPIVARGFLGYRGHFHMRSAYTGELEHGDVPELDRHLTINPFLESLSWGSAFADDPWPTVIPEQHGEELKIAARQERVNRQEPGAIWSVTRRTKFSRAYLSIELHHDDVIVAQVRYQPSRHTEVIEAINAQFGTDYPIDMPVDAVAALLGFQFESVADLQVRLDAASAPDEIAGILQVVSALRHSDLSAVRLYRRYMDHPAQVVRATLCNIFSAYNFESLLEEMAVRETDPALKQQIEDLLDEGIEPTLYDPFHQPPAASAPHPAAPPEPVQTEESAV